jgi:pre-mRNA-splicing factor SPF27
VTAELERVAAKQPLKAIDLSRYEAQDSAPSTENLAPGEAKILLEEALSRSGASATYLAGRRAHLALLDSYGKNAWLVGNWQLEAELKALERELAQTKTEIDVLAVQRRKAQEEAGAEIHGLEETWKKGVGRVLETEIAAEGLRQEVLEQRRHMA